MSTFMHYHPKGGPRLDAAHSRAPLIFSWLGGVAVGLGYLLMPGYLYSALLALGILCFVIFRNFRHGYYLVMALLPVQLTYLSVRPQGMASYEALFFPYYFPLSITFAALLFSMAWRVDRPLRASPINGILLFMVTYMLLSLVWAPHLELGFLLAISLLMNALVFFITKEVIVDGETLRKAARVWIVMGLIAATGVILSQWLTYRNPWRLTASVKLLAWFGEMNSRPSGFGAHDSMAGLLVSSMFITMGFLMNARRALHKLALFLLICYQAVAMIQTVSRGALVGFLAGLFLLFIMHPAVKKILRYFVLSLFLLITLVLVARPGYIDRILVGLGYTGELYFSEVQASASNEAAAAAGMSSRVEKWKAAFREMTKRPYKLILGLGLGGYIAYSGAPHTHSIPLSFFFDMGVFGSVLFIILAIILAMNFSRYRKHAAHTASYYLFLGTVAAFTAEVGVHGLIDYDFYSYTAPMFWFPLGFVCAALNVMRAENPGLHGEA